MAGFGEQEKAESWSVGIMQDSLFLQEHITSYGTSFPRMQRFLAPPLSSQELASLDLQPLALRSVLTKGTIDISTLTLTAQGIELNSLLLLKSISLQFQLLAKHRAPYLSNCLQ